MLMAYETEFLFIVLFCFCRIAPRRIVAHLKGKS